MILPTGMMLNNNKVSFTTKRILFKTLAKSIQIAFKKIIPPRMTPFKKKYRAGFTLLEIMLVAIIVTILVVMAVPNFRKVYDNMELDNATKNILQIMKYAQERGILERCYYRITFADNKYWMEKRLAKEEFSRIKGRIGKTYTFPEAIEVEPEDFQINFLPNGDIDEREIILSNKNDKKYKITTKEPKGHLKLVEL